MAGLLQERSSHDSFLCTALTLATALPEPSSHVYTLPAHTPSTQATLVAPAGSFSSSIPAGLHFSPLAHSLARRSLSPGQPRLSIKERIHSAATDIKIAAKETLAGVAGVGERLLTPALEAASQQVLDILSFMAHLGELLRLPLPVPKGDRLSGFNNLVGGGRGERPLMFAAVLPGDSVAELVIAQGILQFFNIYNTILICRLVLTWFPGTPQAIVNPLATVCDPYLNLFRGIIPPLGGTLDFSPILAFLVLNVFTNTAAAIPAEMGDAEARAQKAAARKTTGKLPWTRR